MSQQPPQGPPPSGYGQQPYGPPPPGWQQPHGPPAPGRPRPPQRPKRKWYTRGWIWLLILMGLPFAGCTVAVIGAASNTSSPPAAEAPVENRTDQTSVEEPAAAPPTAPPTTKTRVDRASCNDKRGDGGPADIKGVALRRDGDQLVVRFTLTKAPPTSGTVLWSVMTSSQSGDQSLQLGVKFLDGEQIAFFVFDFGGAAQQNLSGAASLDGTVLTAAFPYDAVDGLGKRWKWQANTNVEGEDVDDCPDSGDDTLNPRTATFPG